jgi:hypothetical protein
VSAARRTHLANYITNRLARLAKQAEAYDGLLHVLNINIREKDVMNVVLLKALIAFVPAGMLCAGSFTLFSTRKVCGLCYRWGEPRVSWWSFSPTFVRHCTCFLLCNGEWSTVPVITSTYGASFWDSRSSQ